MHNYSDLLGRVALFHGIRPEELQSMLECLAAEVKEHEKGEFLLLAGERPEYVGIVLAGAAQIVKEDCQGSRTILAVAGPGEFFAEALCCAGIEESPVSVVADTGCVVMRLNFARILRTCSNACAFHQQLIGNMLGILARKNLFLQGRMEVVCIKSLREKILKYLESCQAKPGQPVVIPLNREEMADYLSVDRSALSHALMKMTREGLLEYRKNVFTLK